MAGKKSLPVIQYDADIVNPDTQSFKHKPLVCNGCDLHNKKRVPGGGPTGEVDIMFVSESPSSWSSNNQQLFYGRGGRIIREAWKNIVKMDEQSGSLLRAKHLRKWETYAVQCQVEEGKDQSATANKGTIDRCSHFLRSAVLNKRPKIIVAFGATALKALGYKGEKFMEARGRIVEMMVDGQSIKILPTFSTKALIAKTGLYSLFWNDMVRAVRIAAGVDAAMAKVSIEEISKDYLPAPKTVEDVKTVCDHIIDYIVEGATESRQCSLAVDTETNTVNAQRTDAKVLCISFAWDSGKATAIPLWHKEAPWSPEELIEVVAHVQRVLACPKPKVFHNAKFDLKFLELRHGLKVVNLAWDSMLGEHLLREDMSGSYSLKILGRSYFPQYSGYADHIHELASKLTVEEEGVQDVLKGVKKGEIKKGTPGFDPGMTSDMGKPEVERYLFGAKRDRKKKTLDSGYERVPIDDLLTYAAIDTDLTRRLLRNQFMRIKEENYGGARALMASHALPGTRALGKMEFTGMRVDKAYLEYLVVSLSRVVKEKEATLQTYWDADTGHRGKEFNPNSPAQVGEMLFNAGVMNFETGKLELRNNGPWCERNAKSQQWKTDKKTLKAIAEKTGCLFTKTLLDYRGAHKGNTGFIHEIKLLTEYDGYLHTNYHLHGTSTGRLSSSGLNQQNFPKYVAGFNFKKLFVPDDPETELFFNTDAKGAEIRVFTAYAKDEKLVEALNAGLDIHSFFAQEIYGIPYEEMQARESLEKTDKNRFIYLDQLRTNCKRVVFGILYGAMARKIAETAGISEEEAQNVIDKLFMRFPSLKDYMDETVAHIHQFGYVQTLFDRRRRFQLQSVNGFFRGQAERRGKNMKIQSTSSDIVLSVLVELDQHIAELGGRLCLTVHDSVGGTIKKEYAHQLPDFIKHYGTDRVRERYPWLPVDFVWDTGVGPSYGEVVDIHKYLKQEAVRVQTEAEMFRLQLDTDSLDELREDEDDVKEREAVVAAVGT